LKLIILTYSFTDRTTFENVIKWLSFIRTVKIDEAKIILIGNKLDLDMY